MEYNKLVYMYSITALITIFNICYGVELLNIKIHPCGPIMCKQLWQLAGSQSSIPFDALRLTCNLEYGNLGHAINAETRHTLWKGPMDACGKYSQLTRRQRQMNCTMVSRLEFGKPGREMTIHQFHPKQRSTKAVYDRLGDSHLEIKLHEEKINWSEAVETCLSEGGTLMKPYPSEITDLYRIEFYQKRKETDLWIGLYDKNDDDTWWWLDGTRETAWHYWEPAQPNNIMHGVKENCAMSHEIWLAGLKWFDTACSRHAKFVCSRSLT